MRNALGIALLFSLAWLGQAQETAGPPLAEEILDRYVAVTGGQAAYDRIQNQVTALTVSQNSQVFAHSTVFQTRAGDFRMISVAGDKTLATGLNDGIAWTKTPDSAALLETEKERGRVLRDAVLLPESQWRKLYKEAVWETSGMADDRPVDQIAATPFAGLFQRLWFDVRTGLLLKKEVHEPEGWAEFRFEDYFDAGGVKIAKKQTITIDKVTLLVTVDSVQFNQPIPPSTFELPAEIARLLQKKSRQ